jgi:DNA ligase (NAD+)
VPWIFPSSCPSCGQALVRLEGESDTYCVNAECPAQRVQRIAHFCSRAAMDIEGLGESRVQLFVQAGMIREVADLYRLDEAVLIGMEGFGKISAGNLVAAIEQSKSRGMQRLLVALSIRHVGPTVAAALSAAFASLDDLAAASPAHLAAIEGVGGVIAESLAAFFAADGNRDLIEDLRSVGVSFLSLHPQAGAARPEVLVLARKSVVVTGTLEGFTREGAEAAIIERGGKSPGSVSKSTFAVVVRCREAHEGNRTRPPDPRRGRIRAAPRDRRTPRLTRSRRFVPRLGSRDLAQRGGHLELGGRRRH